MCDAVIRLWASRTELKLLPVAVPTHLLWPCRLIPAGRRPPHQRQVHPGHCCRHPGHRGLPWWCHQGAAAGSGERGGVPIRNQGEWHDPVAVDMLRTASCTYEWHPAMPRTKAQQSFAEPHLWRLAGLLGGTQYVTMLPCDSLPAPPPPYTHSTDTDPGWGPHYPHTGGGHHPGHLQPAQCGRQRGQ